MDARLSYPTAYQEPLDPATLTPQQLETYLLAQEEYSASMDDVIQQYGQAMALLAALEGE